MPREVMNCPSAADALLRMCQGPDKTELSEDPAYQPTFTSEKDIFEAQKEQKMAKIKYYIRRIRWLWNHRDMEDCSRKFRMMEYDIKWNLDKR